MITDQRRTIREFSGRIVGYIETNSRTNEALARDFAGRIIGFFDPRYGSQGCTREFSGRILSYGNQLEGLIWNPEYNKTL